MNSSSATTSTAWRRWTLTSTPPGYDFTCVCPVHRTKVLTSAPPKIQWATRKASSAFMASLFFTYFACDLHTPAVMSLATQLLGLPSEELADSARDWRSGMWPKTLPPFVRLSVRIRGLRMEQVTDCNPVLKADAVFHPIINKEQKEREPGRCAADGTNCGGAEGSDKVFRGSTAAASG